MDKRTNKNCHIIRFNHIIGELNSVYHSIAMHFDMSDSAMMILYTLYENNGTYPLNKIISENGISKQTVNSSIRKLEHDGIVTLSAINKKSKLVSLTEKGSAEAKNTVAFVLEAENSILADWDHEDREAFFRSIELFTKKMKEEAKRLGK